MGDDKLWAKAALFASGCFASRAVYEAIDGDWWRAALQVLMAVCMVVVHLRLERAAQGLTAAAEPDPKLK